MKRMMCLLLCCCLMLPALAENRGEYLPLYQSHGAIYGGETVSVSIPEEEVDLLAAQLAMMDSFSLGVGRTFLYLQQGLLIVEFTAQSAGDYCLISCRTEDEWGNSVFEFLFEQFTAAGDRTLAAVYTHENDEWLLTLLP